MTADIRCWSITLLETLFPHKRTCLSPWRYGRYHLCADPVSDTLSIRNADLIPLVTHYNHDQNIYTVYKLSDYTEDLAASHGVHAESTEPFTLETLQEQYKKGADPGLSHPGVAPVF